MNTDSQIENQEIGYAKLNLALHVRKRLPNGYHELETVFAFLNDGDEISVSAASNLELAISGPFAAGLTTEDNLIIKAAQSLQKYSNTIQGAQLHLNKKLPVASGIGGGSADAAATLRLLNRFWRLDLSLDELERIAKPLGADVPACISSQTSFGKGIGQDLQPLENNEFSGRHVVLANPLIAISTQSIFEKWNGVDLGPLDFEDGENLLLTARNDLQPIASNLNNSIAPLLFAFEETSPVAARMSGSGATCFGIYENKEAAALAELKLQSSIERIWTMTGKLR